jgi:WD40 repeat protein
VFDATSGLIEKTLTGQAAVAVSPCGRFLLTSNGSVWNLDDREQSVLARMQRFANPGAVLQAAFSEDDKRLLLRLAPSSDYPSFQYGGVRLLTFTDDGRLQHSDEMGGRQGIVATTLADGANVLAAAAYRLTADYELRATEIDIELWSISPRSRRDVIRENTYQRNELDRSQVRQMSISKDGNWLAMVWNGKPASMDLYSIGEKSELRGTLPLPFEPYDISCAAISAHGRYLAVATDEGDIAVWDAGTGQRKQSLANHDKAVYGLEFSPDERFLAAAGSNGQVDTWDMETGALSGMFAGYDSDVRAIAYSTDGRWLAAGGDNFYGTNVLVWDLATESVVGYASGHGDSVLTLAFSHNGKWLVTGDRSGLTQVWNTDQMISPEISLREGSD